jgi:hypothetical protein
MERGERERERPLFEGERRKERNSLFCLGR